MSSNLPVQSAVSLPVLLVGRDKALVATRMQAMRAAGIAAHAVTPEQAQELALDGHARAWALCASTERSSLLYIACSVRRHSPLSRLLLLEGKSPAGLEVSLFDQVLRGDANAGELAAVVRDLSA